MVVPTTPDPSVAVAVTVTVPTEVADKRPEAALIVAAPVPLITDHATVLVEALAGKTVADICNVPPFATVVELAETVIEVTGTEVVAPKLEINTAGGAVYVTPLMVIVPLYIVPLSITAFVVVAFDKVVFVIVELAAVTLVNVEEAMTEPLVMVEELITL